MALGFNQGTLNTIYLEIFLDLITHIGGDIGAAHAEAGEGVPEGVAKRESVRSEARSNLTHSRPALIGRHARHEEERQRSEDVRSR